MRLVSGVTCHVLVFCKVSKLVGGGSVINWAYPSSLHTRSLCSMECSKMSTDAEATAWGDHGDGYRSGHGGGYSCQTSDLQSIGLDLS